MSTTTTQFANKQTSDWSCSCPFRPQPKKRLLRMRQQQQRPTRHQQHQMVHLTTLVAALAALLALSPVHALTMAPPRAAVASATSVGWSSSSPLLYTNNKNVRLEQASATSYPWSMVFRRGGGGGAAGETTPTTMFLTGTKQSFIQSTASSSFLVCWAPPPHVEGFTTTTTTTTTTRDRGILGFQVVDAAAAGGGDEPQRRTNPKQQPTSSLLLQATRSRENSVDSSSAPTAPWQHLGDSGGNHNNNNNNKDNEGTTTENAAAADAVSSWTSLAFWDAKQLPWLPTALQIEQLTVVQLKQALAERGLPRTGNKADLQRRFLTWTSKQPHHHQQLRQTPAQELTTNSLYRTYGVSSAVPPSQRFASTSTSAPTNEPTTTTETKESQKENNNSNKYHSQDDGAMWWFEGADEYEYGSNNRNNKKQKYRGRLEANSLAEWSRTVDLEPLFSRRQAIHREKQQGKLPPSPPMNQNRFQRQQHPQQQESSSVMSKEEYISVLKKVFDDSSSSRYSNYEVKQIYAAAKEADQMGDRVLSKRILTELQEATPHDMRIYRRLSRMEKEEGNLAQAKAILQQGLRLDPQNAFLWHGLGPLASSTDEAKQYYRTAIRCDPSLPMPYHALGTLEHTQGRIASAMRTLKKGLEYCPTNHRLHHALGDLYRDAKLLSMAANCYRKAITHGPEVSHGFAFNALAYVAYEDENAEECRTWLQKALALNDGRHANSWVALAQMEEAEGNVEAARAVCMAGISKYERGLLKRSFVASQRAPPPVTSIRDDGDNVAAAAAAAPGAAATTATQIRNRLMTRIPVYRSGDRFFNVYRNWARLEERYGTSESVEEVYQRAFLAFPTQWKLTIDWAQYYAQLNMYERASELFAIACSQSAGQDADPYRFHAEYEILARGNYLKAQKILFQGAVALSQTADGTAKGMAELYYVWAICEWHLENLPRAESLLDHALRLTTQGEEGSSMRCLIWYAMAKLQQYQEEPVLAQHCIGLCLKENRMPQTSRVWDLWADVAQGMGNDRLHKQCQQLADKARAQEEGDEPQKLLDLLSPTGATRGGSNTMQHLMRRDPWHYKIFGTSSANNNKERSTSFHAIRLPLLPWEEEEDEV